MSARQISYYDHPNGWIYYASLVSPGTDCRVSDVVRGLADVNRNTLGVTGAPPTGDPLAMAAEAAAVSRVAPTWLDRIMTRSPLRDHDAWRRDGRREYLARRNVRRHNFVAGLPFTGDRNK